MKEKKSILKREEGSTIILVALMLTFLLSMVALALDVGVAYYNKAKLQAACDAAALAAANKLLETQTPALCTGIGKACFDKNFEYVDPVNPYNLNNTLYKYGEPNADGKIDSVYTEATMTSPTSFARLLGIDSMPIRVKAKAKAMRGPADSIWRYSVFSNQHLNLGGTKVEVDGIGSNEDINFGDVSVKVEGTISAQDGIGGDTRLNHVDGELVTGKEYQFSDDCDLIDGYVNTNIKPTEGSVTYFRGDFDGFYAPIPSGWSVSGGTATLTSKRHYAVDPLNIGQVVKNAVIVNRANIVIDKDLIIEDNAMFGGHLTINEGCTVYVKGNCTITNGFKCNGNLIVDKDFNLSGGHFNTDSGKTSTSYICIYGTNASFGMASGTIANTVISARNCTNFALSGSATMTGRIVGEKLSGIDCAYLEVKNMNQVLPFEKMENYYRLVE